MKDGSPLAGQVGVGDKIVAVDGDAGTCDVKLADGTPLQGVAASQVLALHA